MDDQISTAAEAVEAAMLPCRYDANCEGELTVKAEVPDIAAKNPVEKKSAAQWAYERIILYLKSFEEQLDSDHEAAFGFTGGDAGVLRIEGMGYFDPDIVTFYGSDPGGSKIQMVQHVTQLNVMLRALPKKVESAAPNRIGFRLVEALEGGAAKP